MADGRVSEKVYVVYNYVDGCTPELFGVFTDKSDAEKIAGGRGGAVHDFLLDVAELKFL